MPFTEYDLDSRRFATICIVDYAIVPLNINIQPSNDQVESNSGLASRCFFGAAAGKPTLLRLWSPIKIGARV